MKHCGALLGRGMPRPYGQWTNGARADGRHE